MRSSLRLGWLGGLLTTLLHAPLWADEINDDQGANWLLDKYDLNGDEQITRAEVASKRLNIFKHMDANSDGGIDFSEYETMDAAKRQALLKSRFSKVDEDLDGQISQAEYSHYLGMFTRIDSNRDGRLTRTEMAMPEQAETYVNRCLWVLCLRTKIH